MKRSFAVPFAVAVCLALACLVCWSAASSSEDWASLAKQMKEKCGKFGQDVKDFTLVVEMTSKTSEGSMAAQSKVYEKGDKFRAEVTMEAPPNADVPKQMVGMTTTVVGDGKTIWLVNPMGKIQIPASEGDRYRGHWRCDSYIPTTAQIVGSETVAGHDCWIVTTTDEKADFAKLWIDKKSFDLVKLEGKPDKEGKTNVLLFSDFRKVSGDWDVPYKTEVYTGKDLTSTLIMESVEVNKGLSDDLFNVEKLQGGKPDYKEMMKKIKEMQQKGKSE